MKTAWHSQIRRAPKAARTIDGVVFDSASEARRWGELQLLEKAGVIGALRRQVKFPLVLPNGKQVKIRSERYPNGRACSYTADFVYIEDGKEISEEHKGRDDPTSRLRRAVVEAIYGIEILITGEAAHASQKTSRRNHPDRSLDWRSRPPGTAVTSPRYRS